MSAGVLVAIVVRACGQLAAGCGRCLLVPSSIVVGVGVACARGPGPA
ncbi:hypothetical protein [Micromonospora sp. NPDC005313]